MLLLFSSHSTRAVENVMGSRTKKRKYFSVSLVITRCSSLPQEAREAQNGASSRPDPEVSAGEDANRSCQQQLSGEAVQPPPAGSCTITPRRKQPDPSSRDTHCPSAAPGSARSWPAARRSQRAAPNCGATPSTGSRLALPPGSRPHRLHPTLTSRAGLDQHNHLWTPPELGPLNTIFSVLR